jgi:hypothetical protein
MSIEWNRIFPKSTASVDISNEGGTVSLADLKALERTPKPASIKAISDITFGDALLLLFHRLLDFIDADLAHRLPQ